MLQSNRAVHKHAQWLAFDLCVSVGHGNRGLFMAARDQFGTAVLSIIDDRFMQRPEAGARVGADILDAERFDYIDHEVGSRTIRGQDLFRRRGRSSGRLLRFGLSCVSCPSARDQRGCAGHGIPEEIAAINMDFLGFRHSLLQPADMLSTAEV